MNYSDFLLKKAPATKAYGFEPRLDINQMLFPFQRHVVEWALRRGRAAIYADCGMGKGPMSLEWSRHVADYTNGRVIILAPLAVAQQFVREGRKFEIDVTYAKRQSEAPKKGITVTNYERLDAFDTSTFDGVVVDEVSILKSFMGKIKQQILSSFENHQFRLGCSATPAPNDHVELGNQSEFLGVLPSNEMLSRWFINDTMLFGHYRLKGHAVRDFWDWVASWAKCFGKPSDLGFSDEGYALPECEHIRHIIDVDVTVNRQETLFRLPDMSATSLHKEKRLTAADRAAKVAELVASEPDEQWLIWCDTDYEADALTSAIPHAVEVRGSDSVDKKEERLIAFVEGTIKVLITKPKIAGFGLNLQNCARVAFVGATYSYEAFYQAVRRVWRYGQKRTVHIHTVLAATELDVWSVLTRKQTDHESMKVHMFAAMSRAAKQAETTSLYVPKEVAQFPEWLRSA